MTVTSFSNLYQLYWFLRHHRRNGALRRRYYRRIADEKKRLINSGVDGEHLRLLCRYLSNPRNDLALKRLETYAKDQKGNLPAV